MEVEEREDEERGDDRRGDAAQHAPHVLRRDVAPPAVVEAEGDEDREHDRDDEQDDVPFQVAVVVAGTRVEAHVPGRDPRERDQRGIDGDLPESMAVDGEAHGYAGTPTAERTASTTRSCCSRSMPPHIGSARFSAAARSVSGSEPSGTPRYAHRRLEMQRGRVVGGARDSRLAERRRDLGAARRSNGVDVVHVTRLVDGQLDHLTEPELGVPSSRLSACLVPAGQMR